MARGRNWLEPRAEEREARFDELQGALGSLQPSLERVATEVMEAAARIDTAVIPPATARELQLARSELVSLAACCAVSRSTSVEHDLVAAARAVEYVALRGGAVVATLRSVGGCRTAVLERPKALGDLGRLAEELAKELRAALARLGDADRRPKGDLAEQGLQSTRQHTR
jgi:hypothetical protein